MSEWSGDWSSWDEYLIERTLKTWDEFEAWVDKRKAERDKALNDYLEKRNANGTVPPDSPA
jgi:Zn/Cd-binding protein ZinT